MLVYLLNGISIVLGITSVYLNIRIFNLARLILSEGVEDSKFMSKEFGLLDDDIKALKKELKEKKNL